MNTQTPGGQLNNAILDGPLPPVTADEQGWRADLAMVLGMLEVGSA